MKLFQKLKYSMNPTRRALILTYLPSPRCLLCGEFKIKTLTILAVHQRVFFQYFDNLKYF